MTHLKFKSLPSKDKRSMAAWCLFDWGNSAFATVIVTFVFSVYFAKSVIGDEVWGASLWGYAVAASGFLIAMLSPFIGAIADNYGARKPGLFISSLIAVLATSFLYCLIPQSPMWLVFIGLFFFVVANTAFEMSLVFANAMLPFIGPPSMLGRLSGWAWGLGYAGGLSCLVLALWLLIGVGNIEPVFALPQGTGQALRLTAILVAIWYLIFTLPLMFYTKDVARTGLSIKQSVEKGIIQLKGTLVWLRGEKNLSYYLISSAIYREGLNTLFAMGGLYAAQVFLMGYQDLMIFAIGLNVTAGLGAICFSYIDDRVGARKVIILSLLGLIAAGTAILLITDKTDFIILALILGIFIGPAQAAGRSLVARLTPPGYIAQSYGIYNLTGKAASFMGPMAFALITQLTGNLQWGMIAIILFWAFGLYLMWQVKEDKIYEHHNDIIAA
jgi:UMF1 family MFS transporter